MARKILSNYRFMSFRLALIKSKEKKNVILGMHTVYYRRSSLSSVLNWNKLMEFQPDIFVTLNFTANVVELADNLVVNAILRNCTTKGYGRHRSFF